MLDTLLVVGGECEREFRLGIGVDLPCAESAALVVLGAEPFAAPSVAHPHGHATGWLFRLDGSGVVATHWEPLRAVDESPQDSVRATGFRVRILETEGKPGRARLHSFRPIRAARQVDLLGQQLVELRLIDGAVSLDVGAYEWLEVEAEWCEGPT
jgi:alpha-mannosidase